MLPSYKIPRKASKLNFFTCKFHTILSTQDEMKNLLKNGTVIPAYSVISADFQTRGKGRLDRTWHAEKGKNALFSFALYPGFSPEKMYLLYQIAALAVAETLEDVAQTEALIKYPNDILVNGRKIAGILIDSRIKNGRMAHAVTGIGLNVNQKEFPPSLDATSVFNETQKEYEPQIFIEKIVRRFHDILTHAGEDEILSRYLYLWQKKGLKKGIISNNQLFPGQIVALKNDELILLHNNKKKRFPVRKIRAWT